MLSTSESSSLCTTRRRWSEPLCEDKQLAVQDPCVRKSTVDLCEDKQGNQSHLSRHVLPLLLPHHNSNIQLLLHQTSTLLKYSIPECHISIYTYYLECIQILPGEWRLKCNSTAS